MISVQQLAEIISRSPKGTQLTQISRQPGRERWRGKCPFHSPDKTPSFDVFVGADGAGHYYCHGCHNGGSAAWWMRSVEGQSLTVVKPDPEMKRKHEARRVREQALKEYRDRNPACIIPDDFLDLG